MKRTFWVVETDEGFVGRMHMNDPLACNLRKSHAYTYDNEEEATQVATKFASVNGRVVQI